MKNINWFLIFISLLNIFFVINKNKNIIFEKFNPELYQKKYHQSQWVIPNSKNPISDEELYAYAGYRYIQGENPILINPETPPLGKYIIGLSISLFNNHRVIAIISAFLVLALIFFTGGPLAVFLTSINTIFLDQIIHSGQLDIYQVLFLLLFLVSYSSYLKNKKIVSLLLSGIFFGAFVSIKAFFLYYLLFNAWLLLFYLIKRVSLKKSFFDISLLNVIALIFYCLTYFQYFLQQGSWRGFLGVQKWIYLFYSSSSIDKTKLFANYISLILFNRWRFWSDGYPYIKYENWSVLWPAVFILGMAIVIKSLLSRIIESNQGILLNSFIIIYNFFLLIVPVFPRYLLLLFIMLNINIAFYFDKIYKSKGTFIKKIE